MRLYQVRVPRTARTDSNGASQMNQLERHFGKAEEERKKIEAEGAKMNEKMQDFRDTLYGYYVYINLIWIII